MKLYPTPPSIVHLGHHPPWLGYSAHKLAFDKSPHARWPVGPMALSHHNRAGRLRVFFYESGPLLDSKARLYSPEFSYSYCILLHHLSYTSVTILPGLGTAHTNWHLAKLCNQASRQASGPRPSQSHSVQPRLPLVATIGPAG